MTSARRIIVLSAVFSISFLGAPAMVSPVMGQLVPAVENAKYGAAGVVNANSVAVHSGPGENYYPTTRLNKGDTVTVVGVKFDWLKILPPEGSFSFVAKRFVDKTGDATGKVNGANVNVRAGSTLSPMKTAIQTQLQTGDPVEILGEVEEYYKIKAPPGAYLYISKQYVDASKVLGPTDQLVKAPSTPAGGAGTTAGGSTSVSVTPPATPGALDTAGGVATQGTDTGTVPAGPTAPGGGNVTAGGTTTGTGGGAASDPNAAAAERLAKLTGDGGATTRPSNPDVATAIDEYNGAEKSFFEAGNLPIDQQPLAALTQTYQHLVENKNLPRTLRATASARLDALKVRSDAQRSVLETRKAQEAFQQRTAALEAEQKALEAKLNGSQVLVYTAMGQLSTSSLKLGDVPVYRLVDPANGRTLVYIRGNDATLGGLLNQFVGVKGDLVEDPQLSVSIITPKSVEIVDPAKTPATAAQIQPSGIKTASTNEK